jgi:hypothetical protein
MHFAMAHCGALAKFYSHTKFCFVSYLANKNLQQEFQAFFDTNDMFSILLVSG